MAGARSPLGLTIAGSVLVGLFWVTAAVSDLFLDRPFVYTTPDEWSEDLVRAVARFPGPFESGLYLAAAVLLLPAVVCLVVAASTSGVDPLESAVARMGASARGVAVGLSGLAALASGLVSFAAVDGGLLLDDERAYLFEASLFARGHVALAGAPAALHNPMILSHPWMGKYPPGQSLVLLPGVLLGAPHAAPPLVVGLLVFATFGFVREAYGERQGLLAAAILAASPFVWCNGATCAAFSTTACGFTCALWLFARGRRDGRASSYALAGLALGFVGLVRPFDAVALGLPMAVWIAWAAARGEARSSRRGLVAFTATALALVGAHLAFNALSVGSPWTLPYTLANEFHFGFFKLPMPGFAYFHTPSQGLAQLTSALGRLDLWLLGWPGGLLLVLAGAVAAEGAYDRLLVATAAVFAVAYTVPSSSGTWDIGPTYFFALAPVLAVLAVRGVRAIRARFALDAPVARAVGFVPLVGAIVAAVTVTPLHLLRVAALSAEIQAPWRAVEEARLGECVLVIPPAVRMAAAGYALGFPYEIPSGPGTAHLVRPRAPPDLDEARRFLGEDLPVYELRFDVDAFARAGVRRYDIRPAS